LGVLEIHSFPRRRSFAGEELNAYHYRIDESPALHSTRARFCALCGCRLVDEMAAIDALLKGSQP